MTWGKEFAICIPFSAILYTWHAKYSISSSKDIANKSLPRDFLIDCLIERNKCAKLLPWDFKEN